MQAVQRIEREKRMDGGKKRGGGRSPYFCHKAEKAAPYRGGTAPCGAAFLLLRCCLYSTLLPQAGRQLELCWRTSRDSHPSEELSKLRTGVSLWADGVMAEQLAKAALT